MKTLLLVLCLFSSVLIKAQSSIIVTSPIGAEHLQEGKPSDIKWTSTGPIANVRIEYSLDDGANWKQITPSTGNSGTYAWTVPTGSVSDQALIRISDAVSPSVFDVTDKFSILNLKLTSPVGSEHIQAGKPFNITWARSNNLSKVDISYTIDNGTSWTSAVSGYDASKLSYSWNVPQNVSSDQCAVKITETTASSVSDSSTTAFSIVDVKLISPVNGSFMQAGNINTITWQSTPNISNVKLEYSTDNGVNWQTISASVNAAGQSYKWSIPSSVSSDQCKIRVSDAASSSVNDVNSGIFSIVGLTITSPIGGEQILGTAPLKITWNCSSNLANVDIDYSTDNGISWNTLSHGVNAALHSYSQLLPANISSDQFKIRLSDPLAPGFSISSISPNVFSVKQLSLILPNGSEYIKAGSTYKITWTKSSNINNINLEYSLDNGTTWNSIISNYNASALSYSWNVPDNLSTDQALIRISDSSAPQINDLSNAAFHIVSLDITSPNGGEHIQSGSTFNITWTNSGNLSAVDLAYSLDDGKNWMAIASNVSTSSKFYSWPVPSNIFSDQCRIKATGSASASSVSDSSLNKFSIVSFSIINPNGSNQIQAERPYVISWTSGSNLSNVKLEYTTNNGTSWNLIAASVSAALQNYSWNVPNTPSTGCRIRISEVTNPANYVTSDKVFTISSINLTYPGGGENFLDSTVVPIAWKSQNVANIKIEYSLDDGASFNIITVSTSAAAGSYNWTIPHASSGSKCIIRISDAANPTIKDQNGNPFTVSNLILTSPASGSIWQSGSVKNITWTSKYINNVKLEYSSDNGVNWNIITLSAPAASGQYAWTVPNTPSINTLKQCLIRISDQDFPENSKKSSLFSITPVPAILVTSPDGYENWQENSQHDITWTATDNIIAVKIEYSTNNGSSWNNVINPIPANTGTYHWTVPAGTSSAQCRIRITSTADQAVFDQSNNPFVISSLKLTSPSLGTERWQYGKTYNITWSSQNIGNVKLEYSIDNKSSWKTISSSVQADLGNYSWTAPNEPSTTCFIRISDAAHNEIQNINNAALTIVSLALTSPNGGENWIAGTSHPITWTSANISSVRLEYSSDNGSSWQFISSGIPSAGGSFSWTVPAASTNNYKVRISDASDASINDLSDNTFIVSVLTLTSPVGGEKWKVGTVQNIAWTASSTIPNVKIEYTTNNGTSWNVIASSVTSSSSPFQWTIPNTTSDNCRVRISNVTNSEISSVSPALFSITKNVIVTSPMGGENWEIGTIHNIMWQSDPSVHNVKIDYSTDNGTNWVTINSPVDASLHSYTWQIPNTASANCLLKITDLDNSSNFDICDTKFAIISTPSITITRPDGGETFETGAQEPITWTSNNVSNVKIEYSLNNGTSWYLIQSGVASTGSFTWNVPNITSNQCRIKITDLSNPANSDISNGTFTINPRIVVTSPNGNESIPVASNFAIKWTSSNVANVKIDYSTDNGNNWLTVASSVSAASGTYSWTVPNTPASYCLVKISDAVKPEIYDISDNTFSISTKVIVLAPNGGETWQTGSQHDIRWNSNNINNVALSYSTDNGGSWSQIIASVPAVNGSYRWTLPTGIQSAQCKIKVSDASNINVFDVSDNTFTICSLHLNTPNGRENYAISSVQSVTWSSSNISNVKLEYSTNNGLNWKGIVSSLPSSGLYNWEIPNDQSTQCLLKVSDASNPEIFDVSDTTFSITESPTITMLYPNGNEIFRIGTTEVIKWKSNRVTNVKIEYSVNNGTDWKLVAASAPSTGTYSWMIPVENSNSCKVRVSDASNVAINDISALPFTITSAPKITVVTPNGGENYPTGSTQSITWTSSNVSRVKLEYSINNGIDWTLIAASYPSAGVYSWTVPNSTSTQCKIRISDTSNVNTYDISDNNFQINEAPSITVIYPNGKEKFVTGTRETIRWKSNLPNNVKIEYSINNGSDWNLIAASTANTGTYSWLVPNAGSNTCKIRVSDVTKPDVIDASDSLFSIANAPKITLIAPNGSENYQIGSTQSLKWTSSGISNVKIEYSINNGIDWYLIEAAYPSSGIYSWTIPNTPSTQCRVKITDMTNSLNYDVSDSVFTIAASPFLHVTSPNGKENWEIGKTQYITWESENIVNVKIEYSLNNGSDWIVINPNTKSTGSYSWIVPNTPSYQARVRIYDVQNPARYDVSDSVFSITASAKITVSSPNGNESIKAGTLKNITWTSINVANVKIEYSINNGVSWKTIAESAPSTGLYKWTVPDTFSYQCRIRISDLSNSNIVDVSDNNFTISNIQLLSPSTDETMLAGSQYQLTWGSECITNIKIEFSTDNGTTWSTIAASANAITGAYTWNVPQLTARQCMIRISDASNSSISDVSQISFSVQMIILQAPAEKTKWVAGTTQQIQWKSYNVTNVKLEYSTNSGMNWSTIVSSTTAKNGAYSWKVPNSISDLCMLRITDLTNSQNNDVNKGTFSITATSDVAFEDNSIPSECELLQNYPNPFNPSTVINYQLPKAANVSLIVYDVLGNEVAILVDEYRSEGKHSVVFNALNLPSGIYIYKLKADDMLFVRKMLLVK